MMYAFFQKCIQKIEDTVNSVMALDFDHMVNRPQLVVEFVVNARCFYFGTFDSVEQLETWLTENSVSHLKYNIIDLHHPQSSRMDWPI